MAAALCVAAEEAEGMLLAAFQDLQVNNNCADGGSGAVHFFLCTIIIRLNAHFFLVFS